jgi:hypothetical protein
VQLRTTEVVAPDGQVGLAPDEVASADAIDAAIARAVKDARAPRTPGARAAAPARLHADQDLPYADMAFPPVEYRLLALFRFWNVVETLLPRTGRSSARAGTTSCRVTSRSSRPTPTRPTTSSRCAAW